MRSPPEPRHGPAAGAPSPSVFWNGSRLRSDAWERMKIASSRLAEAARRGEDTRATAAEAREALDALETIESYWAFPGKHVVADLVRRLDRREHEALARLTARVMRLLVSHAYRHRDLTTLHGADFDDKEARTDPEEVAGRALRAEARPYFEVLIVDDLTPPEEAEVRARLLELRRPDNEFVYEVVFAPSLEDALVAVLFNPNIQTVVVRYSFPLRSTNRLGPLREYIGWLRHEDLERASENERSHTLGSLIKRLRPELDLFLVTDARIEDVAGRLGHGFRRVFYRQEDYLELHLSVLKGITERYETPFFNAVKAHSQKPTGVFHAMPISRNMSISRSHWIQDMGNFYGTNIFLAETSATTGGLDSLLQPHGTLKKAQELAARAFGAKHTFFVTNGTSTANKIVLQALARPGDIVLASHDCHKSHHYALLLAGAHVVYLDSYPLCEYSMFGAVPLRTIKKTLWDLKQAGKLDRVKLLLLTNCTFDGVTYHPERVMREVLAIKPDMVFVWDEAWFAFGTFTPMYRRRTAMAAARKIRDLLKSDDYRARYAAWKKERARHGGSDERTWLDGELLPDPDLARVRVYVTQSTHKTLTALRQGSMIHVYDQDFEQKAVDAFHEAYMTHTSTSPNYQILASLDVGRRQVELEGYELVQSSIELAMVLRERVNNHPLLKKYFSVLAPKDLVPAAYRPSGLENFDDQATGCSRMEEALAGDEFVLEPTRITLHVGRTGMDGDTFKQFLMDRHDIQINKTSRNTVLFMTHIGTTRGAVAHLIEVFTRIAQEIEERVENQTPIERRLHEQRVASLTKDLPPLPTFSHWHPKFRGAPPHGTREGNMRDAFFLAYDEKNCTYLKLGGEIEAAIAAGNEPVSAGFVTPYPPGFPILVPGQVISPEIVSYLKALDVTEIHGYKPEYGLKLFTEAALADPSIQAGASVPAAAPATVPVTVPVTGARPAAGPPARSRSRS